MKRFLGELAIAAFLIVLDAAATAIADGLVEAWLKKKEAEAKRRRRPSTNDRRGKKRAKARRAEEAHA